jgi:heme A synthase
MSGLNVHRLAVVSAMLAFAAVVGGAVSVGIPDVSGAHMAVSLAAGLALGASAALTRRPAWILAVLSMLAVEGLLGLPSLRSQNIVWAQVAHAVVAHVLFAAAVVIAVMTAPGYAARADELLEDRGVPSLRTLAWITAASVVVQVALGAAYRHKALGVVPHIVWAFAAAILVMMLATFALTTEEIPAGMKFWAVIALSLTGVQILLGVAAYFSRVANADLGALAPSLAFATSAHVATGGMVLGACAALWAHIRMRMAPVSQPMELTESGRTS